MRITHGVVLSNERVRVETHPALTLGDVFFVKGIFSKRCSAEIPKRTVDLSTEGSVYRRNVVAYNEIFLIL